MSLVTRFHVPMEHKFIALVPTQPTGIIPITATLLNNFVGLNSLLGAMSTATNSI